MKCTQQKIFESNNPFRNEPFLVMILFCTVGFRRISTQHQASFFTKQKWAFRLTNAPNKAGAPEYNDVD
jgi:hypothetical protein